MDASIVHADLARRFDSAHRRPPLLPLLLIALAAAPALLAGCLENVAEDEGFYCTQELDCAAGFVCDETRNICIRQQCLAPSDCNDRSECQGPDGCGCVDGRCVEATCGFKGLSEQVCAEGESCHATTRQCVDCARRSDCQPKHFCEPERGTCEPIDLSRCGDGQVDLDLGEQCDGTNVAGFDCVRLGHSGGTLACNDDCSVDDRACIRSVCGDGLVGLGEECDGAELNGGSCEAEGLGAGTLICARECRYDLSGCEGFDPGAACGDGVLDTGEGCDDGGVEAGDGCSAVCAIEEGWRCEQLDGVSDCHEAAPRCEDVIFEKAGGGPVAVPDGDATGVALSLSPNVSVAMGTTFEDAFLEVMTDHTLPQELDFTITLGPVGMPHVIDGANVSWPTNNDPALFPVMGLEGRPVPPMAISVQVTDDRAGNSGQILGIKFKVCTQQ